jgi:hypothetical protein
VVDLAPNSAAKPKRQGEQYLMAKRSNLENAENPNPVSKKSLLAAKRMQRHRERRRRGIRSFSIDLWEAEVDELIRRGLLESKSRNDRNSVVAAFYLFLDQALSEGDAQH